jgi:hypothetical protein
MQHDTEGLAIYTSLLESVITAEAIRKLRIRREGVKCSPGMQAWLSVVRCLVRRC